VPAWHYRHGRQTDIVWQMVEARRRRSASSVDGPVAPRANPNPTLRASIAAATLVGSARLATSRLWPGTTKTVGSAPTPHLHAIDPSHPAAPSWPRRVAKAAAAVTALAERRPFDEEWFEIGGLKLHFETHGHGDRVVVLLHGILLDSQMNRRLAADLAERGYRVVLLDLPGHGRSDKPRHASAHRMDTYGELVIALLDHIDIDRAVIGGVSLGANVALQVATHSPQRVVGLVLEMPVLEWAVPSAAMAFVPLLAGIRVGSGVARVVAAGARQIPTTHVGLVDTVVAALRSDPEEIAAVLHGVLVGPVAPPVEARHAVHEPALVIGHRMDAIHPFTDARHLARQLPQAQLVQANSMVELRLFPTRLTEAIATFVQQAWDLDDRQSQEPLRSSDHPAPA